MKKSLASGVGIAAALVAVFGFGSAAANNEYAGVTYGEVAADIKGYGGTFAIASRVGEYLPTEQCIVTANRRQDGKQLLYLNCNDTYAGSSGHPGNSAATTEGKKALALRELGTKLSKSYAYAVANGITPYCVESAAATQNCIKTCDKSKTCSDELLQALGL